MQLIAKVKEFLEEVQVELCELGNFEFVEVCCVQDLRLLQDRVGIISVEADKKTSYD